MELMDLLPDYYKNCKEVLDVQNAIGEVLEEFNEKREELFVQLFIKDATWGLEAWERMYGIPVERAKGYEPRRERITAKLRGMGTTTKDMIRSVAAAYSNGEAEIIEKPEDYHFYIKFIGKRGIPENMDDLIETMEEIKPAHLSYSFLYVYNTWGELAAMTWEEAAAYTWEGIRERS